MRVQRYISSQTSGKVLTNCNDMYPLYSAIQQCVTVIALFFGSGLTMQGVLNSLPQSDESTQVIPDIELALL